MKKGLTRVLGISLLAGLLTPSFSNAQVTVYGYGTKDGKNGTDQITIIRSDTSKKLILEVDGDNILVNGKKLDEANSDVTIHRSRIGDLHSTAPTRATAFRGSAANSAVLGVTTERADKGVTVLTVSKGSGAEKAGLKKGDNILAIGDAKIESPDDLSKTIRAHKPGDKVVVKYNRDNKEARTTAELQKTSLDEVVVTGFNGQFFNMDMNDYKIHGDLQNFQNNARNLSGSFSFGGAPRLGLTVQDPEDGKGVKVLKVIDDGNGAKAGLKEDDVILEVDGKAVNSADELAKQMKDNKDKISVKFKYDRAGKTNTTDVKIPRKLKTANL